MSQSTHNALSSEKGLHFKHHLLSVERLTEHLQRCCSLDNSVFGSLHTGIIYLYCYIV